MRSAIAWPRIRADLLAGLLISIPILAMILITGLDFRLITDEGAFHIKIIESFADAWPRINLTDYRSASTPLSYLLMTAFGKLVGFDIGKLRLLSAIATFLAAYVFYLASRRLGLPYPLLAALILLLFPYVFFFGQTIYPMAIGLFFGVASLFYYLGDEESMEDLVKGSVLASLAVLCRQSFIVIPVGMLLNEGFQLVRQGFQLNSYKVAAKLFILSVPLLALIPLFVIWGGFTAPANQASEGGEWFLRLSPQHVNYILMVVGFYFLPLIIRLEGDETEISRRFVIIAVAVLLPIFVLFPVVFLSNVPGQVKPSGGIVIRGLNLMSRSIGANYGYLATMALWMAGLLVFARRWRPLSPDAETRKLSLMVVAFIFLMMASPFVYERYYVILVMLLILILYKSFTSKKLLLLWIGVQAALTAGFSYWQIVLK